MTQGMAFKMVRDHTDRARGLWAIGLVHFLSFEISGYQFLGKRPGTVQVAFIKETIKGYKKYLKNHQQKPKKTFKTSRSTSCFVQNLVALPKPNGDFKRKPSPKRTTKSWTHVAKNKSETKKKQSTPPSNHNKPTRPKKTHENSPHHKNLEKPL